MNELIDCLKEISDEKLRTKVINIYNDLLPELQSKPASTKYHHDDEGGLLRHITEVMNVCLFLYDSCPNVYRCTRDQVITAAFVHDFNKIDQYVPAPEWKKVKYQMNFEKVKRPYVNETARTVCVCAEYGLFLDDVVMNAVTFHHGGWSTDSSSPNGYVQSSDITALAALLHAADLVSSFAYGRAKGMEK
jgi:23S rRNA maturation-related 3'-5' exoribonuclease YhaM